MALAAEALAAVDSVGEAADLVDLAVAALAVAERVAVGSFRVVRGGNGSGKID